MQNSDAVSKPGDITGPSQKTPPLNLAQPDARSVLTDWSTRPFGRFALGVGVGAMVGLVGWLLAGLSALPGVFNPLHAAVFILGTAVLCGVGRLATGRVVGTVLGIVVGFTFGVVATPASDAPSSGGHSGFIGKQAEIVGPTLKDGTFDIASMRGKVVLVDFWATWCPPCVGELPGIKRMYDNLHKKGFEVVGVSLDRNRDELEAFIGSKKYDWPQVFFSLPPNKPNPLAVKYEAKFIPHTLLIDREGKIVAVGLRGDRLERAVNKLLAGETLSQTPPAVPPGAWILALCGAVAGSLLQLGSLAGGAGRR